MSALPRSRFAKFLHDNGNILYIPLDKVLYLRQKPGTPTQTEVYLVGSTTPLVIRKTADDIIAILEGNNNVVNGGAATPAPAV